MYSTLHVNLGTEDGDSKVILVDDLDGGVQLSINEDADQPTWQCTYCHAESHEEDMPELPGCRSYDEIVPCPIEIPDHRDCDHCDDDDQVSVHDWQLTPLTWCNSASINVHPDRDQVTVTISVGDPRGAFVMSAYRLDDGSLRLSVPYPGESMPHMPLHRIHDGFYHVGYRAPEPDVVPLTRWQKIKVYLVNVARAVSGKSILGC
jgi:hypothetical protein